jgi:hypothetical protein
MHGLALEGSGDFAAAFLKSLRTQDNEKPQGGQKRQGAENCSHLSSPPLRRYNVLYLFYGVKSGGIDWAQALEPRGFFD